MLMMQDSSITPIIGVGSTNTGNAQVVATLAATAGKTNYLEGFDISGSGATAGVAIEVSIAGLSGGTIKYEFAVIAGALLAAFPAPGLHQHPLPAADTGVGRQHGHHRDRAGVRSGQHQRRRSRLRLPEVTQPAPDP
jgi:hypothetical protein